jgi:hypothetical protein
LSLPGLGALLAGEVEDEIEAAGRDVDGGPAESVAESGDRSVPSTRRHEDPTELRLFGDLDDVHEQFRAVADSTVRSSDGHRDFAVVRE